MPLQTIGEILKYLKQYLNAINDLPKTYYREGYHKKTSTNFLK